MAFLDDVGNTPDRGSILQWLATIEWPTSEMVTPYTPTGWRWYFDVKRACMYLGRGVRGDVIERIYEVELNAWLMQRDATAEHDAVKRPKHYQVFPGIEAIGVIAGSMTEVMFKGYCLGNALKYRLRVGKKDAIEQEVGKAMEYEDLFEKWKHLCRK